MVMVSIRGKIERFDGYILHGWLLRAESPLEPVEFDLVIEQTVVGRFLANLPRGDLSKKGIGSGKHAFRAAIPSSAFTLALNTVRIKIQPEGVFFPQLFEIERSASESKAFPLVISSHLPTQQALQAAPAIELPAALPERSARAAMEIPIAYRTTKPNALTVRPRVQVTKSSAEAPSVGMDIFRKLLSTLLLGAKIDEKIVASLVEQSFKAQQWAIVAAIGAELPKSIKLSAKTLVELGRAHLYLENFDVAHDFLEAARKLEPKKHSGIFYLGIVLMRQQRWTEAESIFKACIEMGAREAKFHLERARALIQIGYGSYGAIVEDRSVLDEALAEFRNAVELDLKGSRPCRELAALEMALGRPQEAIASARLGVARGEKDAGAHADLARMLFRAGHVEDALRSAAVALALDPNGDGTRFNHSLISRFAEIHRAGEPQSIRIIAADAKDLAAEITSAMETWVVFGLPKGMTEADLEALANRSGFAWAGAVGQWRDQTPILWRREHLRLLAQAGLWSRRLPVSENLKRAALVTESAYDRPSGMPSLKAGAPSRLGVLLISQFGAKKFGGAEHFLDQMARIYQAMGLKPVIVGTRAELVGESGEVDGIPFRFIDGSPEELLCLAAELDAGLVHVISGLGYEIASVFRHSKIRIVFGLHFWRELFQHPTPNPGYFPDIDVRTIKRPEFHALIRDVDAIYANSNFTSNIVEKSFGIRTPVIYSLPDDEGEAVRRPPNTTGRDIVLLANARADKGFDLFVQTAARLPAFKFIAIVSQSGEAAARKLIDDEKASNVELVQRVDDMAPLYGRARVVAVPSYRFVETFSRVVIEAHRHGVPVLGSDRGNVPYLLAESGGSLPADPAAWARQIERLFKDDDHWREQSVKALENSRRYSFSMQHQRLSRLVAAVEAPILVGVGSGLGNVIHTTPLIRNLALRLGRPVDVMMAGDYEDLLFAAANQNYVNHVFPASEDVLNRRYEAVFLTHSFGTMPMRFASNRILESRRWDMFRADHPLHEAEFNLAAAEAMLGVPYDEDDVRGYYLGDFTWTKPEKMLVGFHGGSKGGIWASKRWPHYAELARKLKRDGIDVASFGTKDEYVEGTIDMTGGTIEEMARKMLACSHFVANDSGVMNIANALGIPLVALFGPTNVATRGPLGLNSKSIAVEKDCAPCECHPVMRKLSFENGSCRCIAAITASDVLKII